MGVESQGPLRLPPPSLPLGRRARGPFLPRPGGGVATAPARRALGLWLLLIYYERLMGTGFGHRWLAADRPRHWPPAGQAGTRGVRRATVLLPPHRPAPRGDARPAAA